jgi:hypothetical protein
MSQKHLRALADVLDELSEKGAKLVEHHYHPQAFGSFEFVLARGHDRLQFSWDGRDFVLSLSLAKVQNDNEIPQWVHYASFSLPEGDGLYEEITSQASDLLST